MFYFHTCPFHISFVAGKAHKCLALTLGRWWTSEVRGTLSYCGNCKSSIEIEELELNKCVPPPYMLTSLFKAWYGIVTTPNLLFSPFFVIQAFYVN